MVNSNEINYFLSGPNQENDKKVTAEITQQLHEILKMAFNGIGCFEGTFSLWVK